MKLNLKLAQRLFLCLTPLVTGGVFGTLPSFATTLAISEAEGTYTNFSHNPLTVLTQKSPETFESTDNGQVVTKSEADAIFSIEQSNASGTRAFSKSASTVQGDGSDYFETAKSSASVLGYSFQVKAGETFSFDFKGLLNLRTSVDDEPEAANAFGLIAFQLLDLNDLNSPIDFFTISSGLNSLDNSDFLDVFKSSNVAFNPNETNTTTTFGGNKEVANTSFTGRFSRFFNQTTTLILREFKSNNAGASCPSR